MSGAQDKENSWPAPSMLGMMVPQPPQVQLKALWQRSTNRLTTTFDTISQKLRRSTRRREPLINSPGTPCKPNATPVKMYSPFSIDTPKGQPKPPKRNSTVRRSLDKPRKSGGHHSLFDEVDATATPPKNALSFTSQQLVTMSPKLANELQQTQIGVYQLHYAANAIISSKASSASTSTKSD